MFSLRSSRLCVVGFPPLPFDRQNSFNWIIYVLYDKIGTLEVKMALKIGTPAPDFTLPSQLGTPVTLSHLRGKNVVLAFFPLAWTPI